MSEQQPLLEDVDPSFPFWVVENEDGLLTIHWHEDHPITSVFNGWTEEQFIDMLTKRCDEIIEKLSDLNG